MSEHVFKKVTDMIVEGIDSKIITEFIYSTNPVRTDISIDETMVLAFYQDGAVSFTHNYRRVHLFSD